MLVVLLLLLLLLSTCWQSFLWCSRGDCRCWTTTPRPAQRRSLALWHRHSTPCHSIRRLPLPPGLELPPPGAFSSRRLSTRRRIGERARRNKFNISRILGPRQQYSPIYQRKRQLQNVWSRLHSLALASHWWEKRLGHHKHFNKLDVSLDSAVPYHKHSSGDASLLWLWKDIRNSTTILF